MSVIPIVGFALLAVFLLAAIRPVRPELALLLGATSGALILLGLLPRIAQVIDLLERLAEKGGVDAGYLGGVLKIVGVAYVAEFGAQVARDAGEGTLANKVELAGKVAILVLAIPIIMAVLDLILKLLGQG